MIFIRICIYIVGFIFIWFGSGLLVSSASKFSSKLRLSPFAFSFVFLGLLTSIPEFSVGLQALSDNNSDIFVGNLIGGIIVLFLVVIPLLAIFGKGISLKHELDNKTLMATLIVIIAPALFVLDRRVTNFEGCILIILYFVLLYLVERNHGIFDKKNKKLLKFRTYSFVDLIKILLGIGIVFIASKLIVDQTIFFADILGIPSFYISLIIVALGTDLPELTLAIRSVVSGKKEIAMGDYVGAAAVSTFMFGLFTLLHNGEVLTISNFRNTFAFMAIALCLFFYFFRTKNFISRTNGFVMLSLYILFVIFEFVK
jgi:cation:H+ antiporter